MTTTIDRAADKAFEARKMFKLEELIDEAQELHEKAKDRRRSSGRAGEEH
jgi:hypothetical protein